MSDDVQKFLAGYSPAVREIALQVRETILKTVPNADEKVYHGWNSIGYSYGGGMKAQFCAIRSIERSRQPVLQSWRRPRRPC